jgi:tetratricopeptide (TPR) repeat protein
MDWTGRLHRAIELINKAHNDIAREEDNRFAQGLQQRALEHIDKAHHHVEEAIDVIRDR